MKENSPIREIFYRQSGDCELWREKRFIRQDENGVIIPGAFDRVLIHRENGRAVRAHPTCSPRENEGAVGMMFIAPLYFIAEDIFGYLA